LCPALGPGSRAPGTRAAATQASGAKAKHRRDHQEAYCAACVRRADLAAPADEPKRGKSITFFGERLIDL